MYVGKLVEGICRLQVSDLSGVEVEVLGGLKLEMGFLYKRKGVGVP